jgi:hypothetical protein
MTYGSCKICNAVTEGRGSNAASRLYDHIMHNHPDIIAEIQQDEERYRKELRKIKDPISVGSFMRFEDFPKDKGRKEFEDRIVSFERDKKKKRNHLLT